ncbi:H-type lectin domain-containing protein [Alisedimentitalea sp. MJ-SS2]|uniref:H-type lectin domain-containing protein n=1 Tax=Aliisedimentitalea sp. MJ-SS2 TaxID=3049795 RepID=UPI00290C436C|nr:H-type lectin domain-containing protein [Alisedimentitalea sp. MJ-SS2]MDU8927282.1 H-type lectin domain-containing protein [Alisedimentitalea sp. MJ-SS2]
MKKFSTHSIGIAQGDDVIFEDFEDGGEMWTGTGHRERIKEIEFSEPFKEVPAVHVSLSLWDVDNATNMRAEVDAENVTETGFELVFRTWGDTKVARVRIGWMAIGPVKNDDDWELY